MALIPPYLSLQGSRFLLRSASPGRRGGAGAQQGEGRVGGGAGMEMRLGKGWWGSSGWEEESKRSRHGKGHPGCPMMFPPLLLPSVSNMAESRHGELCCAGEADGEERDENFEGRISRVQALSRLSSTVPTFPPASLSGHGGNVQERQRIIFTFLHGKVRLQQAQEFARGCRAVKSLVGT